VGDVDSLCGDAVAVIGLANIINNGVAILTYEDHGSSGSWIGPSWSSSNVTALTNTTYPLVFAYACDTSDYTISQGTFGEEWVTSDHGAGAYVGMSIGEAYRTPEIIFTQGVTKALFTQNVNTVGGLIHAGQMEVINHFVPTSWFTLKHNEMFNLFGDPARPIVQ
jgi:hypothetical protein